MLSKEEWALAFYEIMKEAPPPSGKHLQVVQGKLREQKVATEQRLNQVKNVEETAHYITEDRFTKRDVAYSDYLDRRTDHNKERMETTDRDYARALDEELTAKTTRKQVEGYLDRVNFRIEEVKSRLQTGDFVGMDEELTLAVQQAQLAGKFRSFEPMIEDAKRKIQVHRENRPSSFRSEEAKKDYDNEEKEYRERLKTLLQQQEQVGLLMQGYDDKPASEDRTQELEDKLSKARQAAEESDRTMVERKQAVSGKQEAVAGKQDNLIKAAGQDPSLQEAVQRLGEAREAQDEATRAVEIAREKLSTEHEKQSSVQRLVDKLMAAGSSMNQDLDGALGQLDTIVDAIANGRATLRGAEKTLREAMPRTETALTELRKLAEQRVETEPPNPALKLALDELAAAEDELRRAQSALNQAEREGEHLQGIIGNAQRSLSVAKALPEAHSTSEEFADALKGFEDTPIWDGGEALRKKMGQQQFDKLNQAARKLMFQYEKLVADGATIEELRSVYEQVPELWRPPAFREQERNWVAVGGLMSEEVEDKYRKETSTRLAEVDKKIETFKSKLETGETISSKLASGLGTLTEQGEKAEVLKQISEKLSGTKEFAEQAEKVLGLAAKLAGVLQAPIKAIESAQQSMETEDPVEAMMLQDEFMESLGKLVDGLTGSIEGADKLKVGGALVKNIADLLPGIGVATSAASAMKLMVDSAARIQEAIEDANSHGEALESGHRAEPAIDQFARRDKHLAARAVTGTGVAIIKTAAAGIDLTGVGAPVGGAMKIVATGVQGVQSASEFVIDRQEGEKAEQLLQRAQAGDGNARAELFRFHPRYAKGLLAVMAGEGDAMALRVLSTHGLSDDMIKRSSPKIIKRYLMKKFGEQDEPPSWSGLKKSFDDAVDSLKQKVAAIDTFFDNLAIRLIARLDGDPLIAAQAKLDEALLDLPKQEVAAATTTLLQLRGKRDTLTKQANGEQTTDVQAAELAAAEEEKGFTELRDKVSTSLKSVRGVMTDIGRQSAGPLRDKADKAAKAVVQQHLEVLWQLARVA